MLYDADIVLSFVDEIAEYLPQMRRHLTRLSTKPNDKEALEEVYRLAHTIKGSASMLELDDLTAEGKALEQALLPVVEKKEAFTAALGARLMERVDAVEYKLGAVADQLNGVAEPATVAAPAALPEVAPAALEAPARPAQPPAPVIFEAHPLPQPHWYHAAPTPAPARPAQPEIPDWLAGLSDEAPASDSLDSGPAFLEKLSEQARLQANAPVVPPLKPQDRPKPPTAPRTAPSEPAGLGFAEMLFEPAEPERWTELFASPPAFNPAGLNGNGHHAKGNGHSAWPDQAAGQPDLLADLPPPVTAPASASSGADNGVSLSEFFEALGISLIEPAEPVVPAAIAGGTPDQAAELAAIMNFALPELEAPEPALEPVSPQAPEPAPLSASEPIPGPDPETVPVFELPGLPPDAAEDSNPWGGAAEAAMFAPELHRKESDATVALDPDKVWLPLDFQVPLLDSAAAPADDRLVRPADAGAIVYLGPLTAEGRRQDPDEQAARQAERSDFVPQRGPADLETVEFDGAVLAALEQEAATLPDDFDEADLAGLEVGEDYSLGAFFLAEGQADLDRLADLVAEYSRRPDSSLAVRLIEVAASLRKAAVLMDLEAVAGSLTRLEVAAAPEVGEAPQPEALATALAETLSLLEPYQAAAAAILAPPVPAQPAEEAVETAVQAPATPAPALQAAGGLEAELAEVFVAEAHEHIHDLDTRLAALEQDPYNRELIREIRRSAHTLKGSAAMVSLNVISQTGHLMEDLLDRLYDGSMEVSYSIVELLFETFNAFESLVKAVSAGQPEDAGLLEALRPRYAALLSQAAGPGSEASEESSVVLFAREAPRPTTPQTGMLGLRRLDEVDVAALEAAEMETESSEEAGTTEARPASLRATRAEQDLSVKVPIKPLDAMMNQIGELVINRTVLEQRNQVLNRSVEELTLSIRRLQRVARELETRYEVELLKNAAVGSATPANGYDPHYGGTRPLAPSDGFDTLEMDRYTEFHTLSREMTETVDDLAAELRELSQLNTDFDNALIQQSRLTEDLQERVVKVRLVPVSTLTPRLYRAVRSLAAAQGKEVELVVSGEATQIDKSIIEELSDPLLHLIRNAIDHATEPPEVREATGKPRSATLTFVARSDGQEVVIELRDDGRGIDREAVFRKALERGLVNPGAGLTTQELYELIFQPGFTTRDSVSDVSGRGVGLDVVRAKIARLKGTVEVRSEAGKGTSFIIRLPTTLTMTRAMLVKVEGYTYAIPLGAVERTLKPEPGDIIGDAYYLDGQALPVLELKRWLKLQPHQQRPEDDTPEGEAARREQVYLLVNGPERVVLKVDRLAGQQEVVVKSLGSHLQVVPGITGATILGNGEVILILNTHEIITAALRRRGIVNPLADTDTVEVATARPGRRQTPLIQVVDDSLSIRKVLSTALEKAGYRVRTSKDGQEALEMVQQVAPDLLLMDIEMPRMDGFELTSILKSREAFRHIPVLMLTSRAGIKHRQRAEEVGADGYLIKPYKEAELLQVVGALLSPVLVH